MVHPDQAGRLWPPCGPLHYASALNSTQPKFVELVQQAQTQCNWLRCWAIDNGLAAVPCPVAAAAASAQRQRVREDRPPELPGQAAASSQGMVFSVELLDREGGEIRASLFNEAAEQHYDLMQCGRCFTLCNGSARPAQKKYSVLKHGYELVFDGRCQTHMVDDDADIGAVRLAVQKITSVTQMPVPSSVDICGVIVSAEHPQEFQTKEGQARDHCGRRQRPQRAGYLVTEPD
ncbi:unnamed protein product [Effrenium voratum]|nr:unnamed protein product [Effrenium voratum]